MILKNTKVSKIITAKLGQKHVSNVSKREPDEI